MVDGFIRNIDIIRDDLILFDIGSRDCVQSIEFYKRFPSAKIYAFECNPNTLDICRKNIESFRDRITLIEGAVCDYDGTITFYPINQQKTITTWQDGNPGASSLFRSNGRYTLEKYVQDEITTKCHRLDSVMERHGIPRVDIVWMDLQGAELLALKGLGGHLRDVSYIYTEVTHEEMYSGQAMFKDLNDFIVSAGFRAKNTPTMSGWQEDIIYEKTGLFDIVIPVGPRDIACVRAQLAFTKKNVIGYRRIYLVSYDPTVKMDGCITIDEMSFPFTIETVSTIHGKSDRNGWYLQQLLKLYAGKVIPNILDRYLVVDADTFFLKPTTFVQDNKCLYNFGHDNRHRWYFEHMASLDKDLLAVDEKSGICHHMMFETRFVAELMAKIEEIHKDTFYNVFLKAVTGVSISGASEYEIYFNYIRTHHADAIAIRELKYADLPTFDTTCDQDYISCHWYLR